MQELFNMLYKFNCLNSNNFELRQAQCIILSQLIFVRLDLIHEGEIPHSAALPIRNDISSWLKMWETVRQRRPVSHTHFKGNGVIPNEVRNLIILIANRTMSIFGREATLKLLRIRHKTL